MNGHIEGRDQRRRVDQLGVLVGAIPKVGEQERCKGERRQEKPEEPGEVLWETHLGPLVKCVANEDAQTVGAHVLVGGKVGVAKLLLDRAVQFRVWRRRRRLVG